MLPIRATSPRPPKSPQGASSPARMPLSPSKLEPKPRARDNVVALSDVLDASNDTVVGAKSSLAPISGEFSPVASAAVMLAAMDAQAKQCAVDVSRFIGTITGFMHDIGGLTSDNLHCYKTSAGEMVESVNASTDTMSKFIQRAAVLNAEMQEIELVYRQVSEIKQTLDLLESLVSRLHPERKTRPGGPSASSSTSSSTSLPPPI
ncbi:MAG: hypothetical protein Q8P67_07540 [archaeon]|nr:hypothetical protein [archaeon]